MEQPVKRSERGPEKHIHLLVKQLHLTLQKREKSNCYEYRMTSKNIGTLGEDRGDEMMDDLRNG